MTRIQILIITLLGCGAVASAEFKGVEDILIKNVDARRVDTTLRLTADINLDAVRLGSNRQIYLTPVVEDEKGNVEIMPSLLVNGHAMHIAYERHSLSGDGLKNHQVVEEVKRRNGKKQRVEYSASVPMHKWMYGTSASVRWDIDSCGCGVQGGNGRGDSFPLGLNPAGKMRTAYMTPAVTELPVSIHQGKAHVNFEVAKSVLHTGPYTCRNGQRIDNSAELRMIDDSISRALSDKNVEIAKIKICGYASPEGSYISNDRLSTDRSRALSEYIAARYNLPVGKSEFDAVAENWAGLRKIVETTPILSVSQRKELLELIDRPAYGPSDYDLKDKELRTNPRFSTLYKNTILPEWYPELRTTAFEISTRLKPLTDEELAEVIKTSPEKMSLNQMFRVSTLYPEGSEDFNRVIETALKYYPEDATANLNAAAAALKRGDLARAKGLLVKAGDSPEAENARGILACAEGELDEAAAHFRAAGALPEAAKNLEMLGIQ